MNGSFSVDDKDIAVDVFGQGHDVFVSIGVGGVSVYVNGNGSDCIAGVRSFARKLLAAAARAEIEVFSAPPVPGAVAVDPPAPADVALAPIAF